MVKKQDAGTTFETRVSEWFFVRGYTQGLKDFKLELEVAGTEKFDDVVFDDGSGMSQMIQLKHKQYEKIDLTKSKDPKNIKKNTQNEQPGTSTSQQEEKLVKQVIKVTDLFNERYNTNYNLIKYVKDVNYADSTDRFKDKIKDAVVFTNIGFDLKNDKLNLKGCPSKAANKWFDGIDSIKLTPIQPDPAAIYKMTSVAPEAKYFKFNDDPNIVQILMRQAVTLAKDVGTITEDQIRAALEKIIFAVEQPNVQKLQDIIKDEIKYHFKLHDGETIYCILEKYFRDWCESKNSFGQPSTSLQPVLTYDDVDKFFQQHVKQITFEVTAPTDAFVGRVEELEKIKELLYETHNLIVSQTVTIRGLGGIGKTQLAKQFIKEYGQSEFYGRVIWIEADNDETTKNSFERLAQRVKIQDVYHKNVKVLIDEIFEYFAGLKVLFVFDNFDKCPAYDGNLVTYCWKTVSIPTKRGRPYFLFTSRNRECLPGVPLLDLKVFSAEEAIQLIKNELTNVSLTETDAAKLANVLQCFPLALRQATAYIKEQHTRKQLFKRRYEIQDYYTKFSKFSEETEKLLGFEFPDDFGKNEKTTFITWNVTLDAIKADKVHGANAIQVLQTFAYLYPDKIDPKIFLTLFDNDDVKTADALFILEKYSMVTKIEQEQITFYQIHRLVQTVIQLKFQDKSVAIMEQALKFINPEMYEELHKKLDKINNDDYVIDNLYDLMDECSTDQLLHFYTLSVHMLKHDQLKTKYEDFFNSFNDRVLERATVSDDDVEKLKALEIPAVDLKKFLKINIVIIMYNNCNKVIKYLIESSQLGVNDQVQENSLIKRSIEEYNVHIFKYLIEQGADFSEVLEYASVELISEIKDGKSNLLQGIIKSKSDLNQKILNECFFFATIFNQEAIVQILLENIVQPNFEYKSRTLIEVAARLGFENLIKILLSFNDRQHLKNCVQNLARDRNFSDKQVFEIIYQEYLKKGGDLADTNYLWVEFCFRFNLDKLDLTYFLLDEDVDLHLSSGYGQTALRLLLEKHHKSFFNVGDKRHFDELFNQIIFQTLTPDKFVNVSALCVLKTNNWLTKECYRSFFEKMVAKVGGINVRNEEGETVLLKYLKHKYSRPKIETVKFLVEQGVDFEVQDSEGKPALYFAVKEFKVFEYLQAHVKSVDENVLENAIKVGNKRSVEKLLEKHFSAEHRFENRKSLFEVAVESVSLNVVFLWKDEFKKYLERRGDVYKRDEDGRTLLIKLIRNLNYDRGDGDFDDVKFLVENGCDVDIRDNDGHSAFFWAATKKTKNIFLYLLENSKLVDEEALFEAITENVLSNVEDLPQNFDKNHILKMKSKLLEYAKRSKKDFIIDFLNELETKNKIKPENEREALNKKCKSKRNCLII